MEWFVNWSIWHWLILGFVLLIAEIAMPGVFLLWWGLAAIVVAGIMTSFSSSSSLRHYCHHVERNLVALST